MDNQPDIPMPTRILSNNSGEVVLYQPNDEVKVEVRIDMETVWLSQSQMAELFGTQRQAITKHLKNIFDTHELERTSTSSILELLRKEGSRMVRRQVELFNLDKTIYHIGPRSKTLATAGSPSPRWR